MTKLPGISEVRELLREERSRLGVRLWRRFRFRKSLGMWRAMDFRFERQYWSQRRLLLRGRVVWGAFIQANTGLFQTGKGDLPASILYSADPGVEAEPGRLLEVALRLYALRGKFTVRSLRRISDHLEDGLAADTKLAVPMEAADGLEVFYSFVMVVRAHLFRGRIHSLLLPVLILPEETRAVMILPSAFWPEGFERTVKEAELRAASEPAIGHLLGSPVEYERLRLKQVSLKWLLRLGYPAMLCGLAKLRGLAGTEMLVFFLSTGFFLLFAAVAPLVGRLFMPLLRLYGIKGDRGGRGFELRGMGDWFQVLFSMALHTSVAWVAINKVLEVEQER